MREDTEAAILAAIEVAQANKDHKWAAALLTIMGVKSEPGLQAILFSFMKSFAIQILAVADKIKSANKARNN